MSWILEEYINRDGQSPFRLWLGKLPIGIRARVQAALFRVLEGNLGDYKSVGGGIYEKRFHFGSGYRVYFALSHTTVVILLTGGDKSTQTQDIRKAKKNWIDFKRRKDHD